MELIALTLVAAEIGTDAGTLAHRLGDAVVVNAAGLRALPVDRCRAVIDDHHAAAQAASERAAEMAARPGPMDQVRRLVAAIDERDERLRAPGMLDAGMTAFARMQIADHEAKLEVKGRYLDEMIQNGIDGTLRMHAIDQEGA